MRRLGKEHYRANRRPSRILVRFAAMVTLLVSLPNICVTAEPPSASPGLIKVLTTPDANPPANPARLPPLPATETNPIAPEPVPAGPVISGTGSSSGKLELVEFRDQPLGDALRLFSAQTGLNIVASPEARKLSVSIYLRNVTPEAALDALCKTHDLWHKDDPATGIIRISTAKEYQRDLSSFREEQTEVFTLLYPNPVDVATAIRSIYGDRVILNLEPMWQDAYQDLEERFNRFDLVDQRSQGLGILNSSNNGNGSGYGGIGTNSGVGGGMSGYGGRGTGGGGGMSGYGGGASSYRRQDLISDSRAARQDYQQRQSQPNLSADQIAALEADAKAQGKIDPAVLDQILARRPASIYVTVIRPHNQLIVRTSDDKTMQQIRELVARVDIPTPLVLLEVKILQVDLGDSFNSVFDYQFSDGATSAGSFTTGNILPPLSDNPAQITPPATRRDSILAPAGLLDTTGALTNQPPRDLMFQFVNNNFRFRMQLLENNNRVTTMATPLLLTANNEVSRLFVGNEVPLNRSFSGPTPIVNSTTATTYAAGSTNIEFRPVGTNLMITPNINADRTVTLRILQEVSEVDPNGANILVPSNTGFQQTKIDTVQSRSVSGTVVGKDGLTVAIGGLIQETLSDSRAEVPVLGKLPVIGFFFREQHSKRKRTELVILIRPYVFSTPAESACTNAQLIQDLSIHPKAGDPSGTLNSFLPHEVTRANPPQTECQKIFRFHSLEPKRF